MHSMHCLPINPQLLIVNYKKTKNNIATRKWKFRQNLKVNTIKY